MNDCYKLIFYTGMAVELKILLSNFYKNDTVVKFGHWQPVYIVILAINIEW